MFKKDTLVSKSVFSTEGQEGWQEGAGYLPVLTVYLMSSLHAKFYENTLFTSSINISEVAKTKE